MATLRAPLDWSSPEVRPREPLADGLGAVDRHLVALARERGPLRAVLARIAFRLVGCRAWERLGYARLSDYAPERLGLSARLVQSLAEVGVGLLSRPRLESALVSGELGWTKVRLLARLPVDEDEGPWIARARRISARELSKEVRAVDRRSLEGGGADESWARSRVFEIRCTPEVRWKWNLARGAAARAAGRRLHVVESAELIAAEVLSAVPLEGGADEEACDEPGLTWGRAVAPEGESQEGEGREEREGQPGEQGHAGQVGQQGPARRSPPPRPLIPAALEALVAGLEEADAFALDERLRQALSREQSLDARLSPLLALVWRRPVHRALGHPTREAYARDRLGMDPTRARALVRLEHTAALDPDFAHAYRSGALSWVKGAILAPLVSADPLGWHVGAWVEWAKSVTVRRLSDDVEHALTVAETDPEAFRRDGGLPSEARHGRTPDHGMGSLPHREIGAGHTDAPGIPPGPGDPTGGSGLDREIGAGHRGAQGDNRPPRPTDWIGRREWPLKSTPAEVCWVRFVGPPDVANLFRAVVSTVRRRIERETGRLPTAGEALDAMLDHVLSTWGALDHKVKARYRVFARDGWRCATPGCSSMQNLHDHHIRFRSAQGTNDLENRITLCAFHHLRGVHAGLLRCIGRSPDGLRWELGIRPGREPLVTYRSGDVEVRVPPPRRQILPAPRVPMNPRRIETRAAGAVGRPGRWKNVVPAPVTAEPFSRPPRPFQ